MWWKFKKKTNNEIKGIKVKCQWGACANNHKGYCNCKDLEITLLSTKDNDNKKDYMECKNFSWE